MFEMGSEDLQLTVAEARSADDGWNCDFLRRSLPHHIVGLVAGMEPPCDTLGEDDIIWGPDPRRRFSLKTAYEIASTAEDTWRSLMIVRDAGATLKTCSMSFGIVGWQERFSPLSSLLTSGRIFSLTVCRFGSKGDSNTLTLDSPLASRFGFFGRRVMRQSLRINLRHAISSAYESFTGSSGFERQ
ncbi:hypothetical protein LINPERHAP1_LOCUS18709 [Linum perenne]